MNRLGSLVATLVICLAVAGTVAVGVTINSVPPMELAYDEPVAAPPNPPVLLHPAGRNSGSFEEHARLAHQLDRVATDPAFGELVARVVDTSSGEIVWDHGGNLPRRPASVTKVLTAAAAVMTLSPTDRLTTEVVAGADPGEIILVAGGDVMLNEERIISLAEQVTRNHPNPVTTITVDTALWSRQTLAAGWHTEDIPGGWIAPMEPVMIEGGRLGGVTGSLPRSTEPALDVGRALARHLGDGTAVVRAGHVPAVHKTAPRLGVVRSETFRDRLAQMMDHSDNVMAEALGREVAVKQLVEQPDSQAAADAVLMVLAKNGIDTTGVILADTSGMSDLNLIPPAALTSVLQKAATDPTLTPLLASFPIAAATGTLAERYTGVAGAGDGAGWVRAKTGTLAGTSALAGTVTSTSGAVYAFAFISSGSAVYPARAALDRLAATLHDSGGNSAPVFAPVEPGDGQRHTDHVEPGQS